MDIFNYKIIEDFNFTREVEISTCTSLFERIFLPKYWGKRLKISRTKVPNPEFLIDHVNRVIVCHPIYRTKLNFYLQKIGDRNYDLPWLHRPQQTKM